MKTIILYTIFLVISIFSLSTNAQSSAEKSRAEFLTKYYDSYYNGVNGAANLHTGLDISDSAKSTIEADKSDGQNSITDSLVNQRKIKSINANCLNSLLNENTFVVESAIYISIQFKNRFPKENFSKIIEVLDEITRKAESSRLSYKAQLAKIYISNANWFENIKVKSIDKEQEVYAEIAETVSAKMFSTDF